MMDLYQFLVMGIFGNFWITVLALCFIFGIILVIGNVSAFTSMFVIGAFLYCMAIGYGNPLIALPLMILFIGWGVYGIVRIINAMYQ